MHRNKSTSTLLWSPWQAVQSHHKAAPPSLPRESHDPFQVSSGFTGRGLPSDGDFSVQVHFLPSSAEAQAGAEPARLCLELHPAQSLTPPPSPAHTHQNQQITLPAHSTHPGCSSAIPFWKRKRGRSPTWAGAGPFLTTFVCHCLMSTQFRTFFP